MGKIGRPLKYTDEDLLSVYKLRLETGWGCLKISRQLKMPRSTVSRMLYQTPIISSKSFPILVNNRIKKLKKDNSFHLSCVYKNNKKLKILKDILKFSTEKDEDKNGSI